MTLDAIGFPLDDCSAPSSRQSRLDSEFESESSHSQPRKCKAGLKRLERAINYPKVASINWSPLIIGLKFAPVWSLPIDCFPQLHEANEWVGLRTIVVVKRRRHLWNQTTHEMQFYLSSLPATDPRIGAAIRQHWGIENSQHWVLDVTEGEDACRVRSLHAPQNLARLRRFALNALNRESTCKRSLKQKSKQTAMNDDYMLKVLAASLPDRVQDSSLET